MAAGATKHACAIPAAPFTSVRGNSRPDIPGGTQLKMARPPSCNCSGIVRAPPSSPARPQSNPSCTFPSLAQVACPPNRTNRYWVKLSVALEEFLGPCVGSCVTTTTTTRRRQRRRRQRNKNNNTNYARERRATTTTPLDRENVACGLFSSSMRMTLRPFLSVVNWYSRLSLLGLSVTL